MHENKVRMNKMIQIQRMILKILGTSAMYYPLVMVRWQNLILVIIYARTQMKPNARTQSTNNELDFIF